MTADVRSQGGGPSERPVGTGGERHYHGAQVCHQEHAQRQACRPHILHGRCPPLLMRHAPAVTALICQIIQILHAVCTNTS